MSTRWSSSCLKESGITAGMRSDRVPRQQARLDEWAAGARPYSASFLYRRNFPKRNPETLIAATRCTPPCRSLSAGKLRFHQRRYFCHVGAPRELALQCPHDFAHIGHALCARLRDCRGDLLSDLCVRQLLGQVAREKIQLEGLAVDEILAVASLELRNGVAALLDHLLDDRHDLGVGKLFPLFDFALLDRI